jgi:hypothetical protein
VNRRCQEETVQVPEVRDQEQEEVWAQVAAQELVEVWELAAVVWAGWAELAQGQDPADSASVHHAVLQQHTASAFRVTRWRVHDVELRW